jgi:hypothetical protein
VRHVVCACVQVTCWDCGKRVGIIPAVDDHANGVIHKICALCYNKWRRYLKDGGPQSSVFKTVVS